MTSRITQIAASWPENYRTAYACLVLKAMDALETAFMYTPILQLLESDVCWHYYPAHMDSVLRPDGDGDGDGDVLDRLCKVASVQSNIAYLKGTHSILNMLPNTLIDVVRYPMFILIRRQKLTLTSIALMAVLFYFVLSQFAHKKTIILPMSRIVW